MSSGSETLHVFVPSVLIVPQRLPPPPPPVPGTVKPEDLRPPANPPIHFLKPWKQFEEREQKTDGEPIPVTIEGDHLVRFNEKHDVRHTLEVVFKDREDCSDVVDDVLASLKDPFRANEHSRIVWSLVQAVKANPDRDAKLGGKKLIRRHKILKGPAWSIVSYGEESVGVRRNMIYDGEGNAIAQVDFGHGSTIGIHVHALVIDNLAHTPGNSEDHCFELMSVPWPWLCIPDVRFANNPAKAGLQYSTLPASLDVVQGRMKWVPITVRFEDYLGERAYSDEW